MSASEPSARKSNWITWLLLAVWATVIVVALALLSLKHLAALPRPSNEALLTRALLKYRRERSRKFIVHVIYSGCSCSSGLLTHLLTRRPFPGEEELILFVGIDRAKERLIANSSFELKIVSASGLVAEFGLEAAPVMFIFDQDGNLRYAGGYYDHPAAITPLDESIQAKLMAGFPVEPLPVFGCAVSPRLQNQLNPLRLLRLDKS